jgi:2-oxo-4-hydroxy-4-carboxy-5-ureidoimidazoline decarboxylase
VVVRRRSRCAAAGVPGTGAEHESPAGTAPRFVRSANRPPPSPGATLQAHAEEEADTVERFNAAPAEDLRTELRACLSCTAWVDRVLDGRPYRDRDELVAAGERAVLALDDHDVDAALDGHPRIGERPGAAHADGAALSVREQSGVDGAGAGIRARLADGNQRYEQRFGRVFLVRAAGRDAAGLLSELERRLGNDPVRERDETVAALAEITALRLREVAR